MIVVSRDYHTWPLPTSRDSAMAPYGRKPERKWLASVGVWDGETWELRYGRFCTLRCAHDFAEAAYKAGYRITTAKGSN
jgi:hypothetical protein